MRDPFLNGDAAIGKGRNLVRVVGHQPHPVETELVQDLGGGQINPLIGIEAELFVGVHGVETPVLQFIGPELVDKANTPAFLGEVDQDTGGCQGDRR